ncbi:cupin domain-containing protein [Marinomonas sp. TI.3.20]|uniref:cupin domain-containing protein n=1 Tax=Marinomonas sp. TI.3.20 TaxID=3121296 RepID=UPI00311E0F80
MQINSDFSAVATVAAKDYHWVPSTQFGVDRMMLDRLGEEKARATSVVRYAPESVFPNHAHPGGEEIFVLSGTFSDQSGDYPQGWYLRNPIGTQHAPFSHQGATIFVKLWQMNKADQSTVRINTYDPESWGIENGRAVCALFEDQYETTSLQKLTPSEALFQTLPMAAPAELLVLSGDLLFDGVEYAEGSWLRLPLGNNVSVLAGESGATVYLKQGEFQNVHHKATV